MELNRGFFPKLLIGAFVISIVAFLVRGFGQLVVGAETAQLLAAPFFLVGIVLAVVAFVLSVLATAGIIGSEPTI